MKNSPLGNVFVGIVCMMVIGCSNSELSSVPESQLAVADTPLSDKAVSENIEAPLGQNLTIYLQGVEDKLGQLKNKHAKEAAPGSDSIMTLDVMLVELTKKGEEVQLQIAALKAAKGEDQNVLQTGMDKTLADLDQSYDKALAQFAG
jgi:hypothetical protein